MLADVNHTLDIFLEWLSLAFLCFGSWQMIDVDNKDVKAVQRKGCTNEQQCKYPTREASISLSADG